MPTRFPKTLNLYTDRNSLWMAPTPWPQLSGWSVWHDDFDKFAGWTTLADTTGTAGLGGTSANNGLGSIDILSPATNNDKTTLFLTPRVANTLVTQIAPISADWIFGCAFGIATNVLQGLAIGFATGATVNTAGTAGDMASATPTNGIYVRKAVGSNVIEFINYRSGVLQTQITCVAAASVALTTRWKIVARYHNNVTTVYVNDTQVGTSTGLSNMAAGISAFIQHKAGAAEIETLNVDYLYFASATLQTTAGNTAGRV
jgi:hypothetical protein